MAGLIGYDKIARNFWGLGNLMESGDPRKFSYYYLISKYSMEEFNLFDRMTKKSLIVRVQ